MTWLRRAGVSVFCVCVALAAGIGLGAGPLQTSPAADASARLDAANAALHDKVSDLRHASAISEAVAAASAPSWLDETLKGRSVTLVVLPDVSTDTVDRFHDVVLQAGGVLAATVVLSSDFDDPSNKTYVQSVTNSSIAGLRDLAETATSADPYEQAGSLVARAYVGHSNHSTLDDEAVKIDSELQGAELVHLQGEQTRRGSLALMLSVGDHARGETSQARHLIQTALVSGLAEGADAVVVSAPASGARPGGLLTTIAEDKSVQDLALSTINVQQGSAAEVATVYALTAALSGQGQAFGVDGSHVVLPPGMSTLSQ